MKKENNLSKYLSKNPLKRALINNFQSSLVEIIKSIGPQSILDAGCGEGFNIEYISRNYHCEIKGFDLEEEALQNAKERLGDIHIIKGSVYSIPFPDKSFDLVVCNEVLEHLEYPLDAIKELLRVTKDKIILSVPHEPFFRIGNFVSLFHFFKLGNPPGHINHWTHGSFKRFISSEVYVVDIKKPFPWILVTCQSNNHKILE